jgi:hypothetical protein
MTEGPAGQPSDVYSRYGLRRHTEMQTGQQVQDTVNHDIKERYGPFLGMIVGMVQAPGRVDDMLDSQAASLKGQVLARSAPAQPDAHYIGIPHPQLHEMVNNAVDPGVVGASADTYTQIGNKLTAFQDRIATSIGSSEADWTGDAGEQARRAVAGLGNKAAEAGTAAQLAGTLFTQQARSLSTAKNSVPLPPAQPYDPAASQAKLMATTDPISFIMQAAADKAAFQQQQKDHQEAARAVETYDRTVTQTAAAQPAFAPAPVAPPQPQPETPSQPPVGGDDSNGRGFTPPPAVGDTTNTSWTAPPTTDPGGNTNPSGNTGLDVGKNPPGLGGGQPGTGNQGGSGPGLGGGFVPGPGSGNKGGLGGSRTGGGPGSPATGRGSTGTGTGSGRSPAGTGIGGPNAAKGLGGPNALKGFGPGGSSGLLPGEGSTGRGGLGAGGAAAGRGGAGAGAMGGMGAGGAKGEGGEDTEHQTPSYLVNEDNGNEIVGDMGMVVPPTIGA